MKLTSLWGVLSLALAFSTVAQSDLSPSARLLQQAIRDNAERGLNPGSETYRKLLSLGAKEGSALIPLFHEKGRSGQMGPQDLAIRLSGDLRLANTVPALTALLNDPAVPVSAQWSAANALTQIGTREAVEALLRELHGDYHDEILMYDRARSATIIAAVTNPDATEVLIAFLRRTSRATDDLTKSFRTRCYKALANIATAQSVSYLANILTVGREEQRRELACLLGNAKEFKKYKALLLKAFVHERQMTVRICIAGSLWKREGSHAAWSFLRSTVNDREADDDMRVFAIQRLCESATNEVLSFFRELVTTGKDEHVEGAAFDALARHGDVQDLALLRKLARRTEDDDERSHKMKSISRMEIRLEGMKGNPRPAH